MRTIRVISPQSTSARTFESEATSWGDLREELSETYSGISDMKAIVRENRNTLESDSASLPEGNFTIILSMKKIASGNHTRYTDSQIKELRTKLLNLLEDVLSETEASLPDQELSEEELEDLENLRSEGLA
jgi:gas vesicle protein